MLTRVEASWRVYLAVLLAGALAGAGCGNSSQMRADPQKAVTDARTTMRQAAEDRDPVIRMHALEALAQSDDPLAAGIMMQAMSDPLPAVRFAAVMGIGDIVYAPAKPRLLKVMSMKDTDPSVQCAVIYALHQMKDDTYTSRLGNLLFSNSNEVRGNAALAMGKMGDPSAIRPLSSVLHDWHDPGVQLQVLESLTALGDRKSERVLTAYIRDRYMDERMLAVQALGRARSMAAKSSILLAFGSDEPPQLRLIAAWSLARLGDKRGYDVAVEAIQRTDVTIRRFYGDNTVIQDPLRYQLQQLAALALGQMGENSGVDVLLPLLGSHDGAVRVAAAKAILQLLKPEGTPAAVPSEDGPPPPAKLPAAQASAATPPPTSAPAPLPANVLQIAPARD